MILRLAMIVTVPKVEKVQRVLGLYLLLMGTAQVSLYSWLAVHSNSSVFDSVFYFDPRISIYVMESALAGEEFAKTGFLRWFTVSVPLIFGLRFLMGKPTRIYLAIEVVLSLPFVLFSLFVLVANLSPSHGFSIGELTFPILVFVLFSGVPIALAARLRQLETRNQDLVTQT